MWGPDKNLSDRKGSVILDGSTESKRLAVSGTLFAVELTGIGDAAVLPSLGKIDGGARTGGAWVIGIEVSKTMSAATLEMLDETSGSTVFPSMDEIDG